MKVTSAQFISSVASLSACPKTGFKEYAFIGRSNVGKSSLINALLNRKDLAKTSSRPGKTQTINHFLVNEAFYLVDLPGYGYAKVRIESQNKWEKFVNDYILKREEMVQLFVLVDSNIPPQKIDLEFINFLGINSVPFSIVLTKTDRISKTELVKSQVALEKKLLEYWEELPVITKVSSEKRIGLDLIWERMQA
ncbi:MAG: ribosome biogenesis GTP-binding protein YihA/YsxC [Bacteroidia bacterium]|nr:ribosome biogenesis GTP-binding protein YihA/YsxC [Bacteroidia bacterium]